MAVRTLALCLVGMLFRGRIIASCRLALSAPMVSITILSTFVLGLRLVAHLFTSKTGYFGTCLSSNSQRWPLLDQLSGALLHHPHNQLTMQVAQFDTAAGLVV